MNRVYLLSYCMKVDGSYAVFHFNGVYKGKKIKKIIVLKNDLIKKDQVFLLDLSITNIEKDILYCKLNRLKQINFLF